ncbi:MAG TPA: tetratricopeptide repeat protein [Candidatus Dormibacteraeota bacterium]|jgi:DNA-binding winged helix-turn-helix (wHTH) protein/tetratricopeptide (TPR) repeat protein|nr:tetratricopeptide repeat protein [Candidatus Dormibacteraeota bacterium]
MQVAEGDLRTRGFGVFEIDLKSAELRKHGIRIKLQEQPFQILAYLLEHPGDVVTREELRQKLWSAHTFVDFDRSLNKAMTKLRSALGDSAENPRYIETVPRHGYRFLAEVRTPHHTPVEAHSISLDHSIHAGSPDNETQRTQVEPGSLRRAFQSLYFRIPSGRRRGYAVGTIVLAAAIAAFAFLRIEQLVVHGVSPAAAHPRRSVAVLGFKNLSGDAQEAWLSTALSNWLMTELTAGEQLRAIPAEGIARMKAELSLPDADSLEPASLARIRKNLGTDFVVVGSYAQFGAKADGQIRLDVRLQDTQSGETVGAFSESGTESRLLDLVSRAGEHLREKLGIRAVTKEEAAEVAISVPSKAETAKFYSEALSKLRVFDPISAHDLLVKAIDAEPDYAPAHAAMATAYLRLGYDDKAVGEAKKAFDLSSNLSRAEHLLVEGRYREVSRDWDRAIEIYRALFDFFPDNLEYGLSLASAEVAANKWKEGLDTLTTLRSLPSPLRDDPRIDLTENDAAQALGDTKRAEAALARAVEKARTAGASLLLAKARRDQAWLFENSGREELVDAATSESMKLYQAAYDSPGVASVVTLQAIAMERQGDYLGAKKKYEESLTLYRESSNKQSIGAEYDNLGDILLYLGELSASEKSYQSALTTYRDIGDQNGVALAKIGLGDVFFSLGKHSEAKEMYADAAAICRQLGSRNREAIALAGTGRVLQLEGDSEGARKKEADSIAILETVGNRSEAERVRMQLAELLLDEGKTAQARDWAKKSAAVLEESKSVRQATAANLVLARALLDAGQSAEAQVVAQRVSENANKSGDRELQMLSEITAARIQASTGKASDVSDALRKLNKVSSQASTFSLVPVALNARLAAGEIQANRGNRAEGRAWLEQLQKDSEKGGFQLIARRAASAMASSQPKPRS